MLYQYHQLYYFSNYGSCHLQLRQYQYLSPVEEACSERHTTVRLFTAMLSCYTTNYLVIFYMCTTYSFSSSNGNFELRYSLVSKGSCHARSKLRLSLLRNKAAPTLHARKMNTSSFTLIHLHRVPSLSDTVRPPCPWTWLLWGTPGCKLSGGGSVSVGCSISSDLSFSNPNVKGMFIPRSPTTHRPSGNETSALITCTDTWDTFARAHAQ